MFEEVATPLHMGYENFGHCFASFSFSSSIDLDLSSSKLKPSAPSSCGIGESFQINDSLISSGTFIKLCQILSLQLGLICVFVFGNISSFLATSFSSLSLDNKYLHSTTLTASMAWRFRNNLRDGSPPPVSYYPSLGPHLHPSHQPGMSAH